MRPSRIACSSVQIGVLPTPSASIGALMLSIAGYVGSVVATEVQASSHGAGDGHCSAKKLQCCPHVLAQQGPVAAIDTKDILLRLPRALPIETLQELAFIRDDSGSFASGSIEDDVGSKRKKP